jgi:hypothetical protein
MKSSRRILIVLALFAAMFSEQPALAQRSFGRTNSLVSLAAYEAVQKDLAVPAELAARLNTLNDEYRAASQKEFTALGIDYSALGDLPAAERAAEMRKVTEKTAGVNRKLMADFLPKLAQILTPDQIGRLKEIQLQASGIDVWIEPEFAKELDLTDDQKARLTELRNDYNRRQQQLDGDFQQRFAKIRELNTERDARALTMLTEQQKSKLTEMKGAPFDVSQIGFGRRRGNN